MHTRYMRYMRQPFILFGIAIAAVACIIDQASKLYLLFVFQIAENGPVRLGPFLDLVFARNFGISYGLLQTQSQFGQWLLLTVKALAIALLGFWLLRAQNRLTALALGLIIGGAMGNVIDRLVHGWVLDFLFFHIWTAHWQFNWYVFNFADVAIVAGVLGLLYDSMAGGQAAKAP